MAGKTVGSCAFDKLFPKSVPHVLEKIFLSHDYTSFKNCLDVNNTWNMLLTSNTICRMYISTPLCEAARNDHTNVVQVLLDNGAEPNRANIYGTTPLHEATCNKN